MPRMRSSLSKIEDYPAHLDMMWQKHLAPREPDAPTVISTFAGGGGSSLGYSMAGFRELLAVEWDDNAVETFKLNFPDVPVYHGDIARLSVEQVLEMTGLQPGELDIFDGSPPCQGFSTAGKRNFSDDRNQLFREYVRLLRGLQPKVFVMENVSGLIKGKMKLIFAEILRELKASGYKVSARLLNAMWFGVPQSRQRLIFIGVRDDLGIEPSHPAAERKKICVGSAIEKCDYYQDSPRMSEKFSEYWHNAGQGGSMGRFSSSKRLSEARPSPTLSSSEGYGGVYHPIECRPLSSSERKRLGSYPDRFMFIDWKTCIERIGNSVPPLFMEAVARHIRTNTLERWHEMTGSIPGLIHS